MGMSNLPESPIVPISSWMSVVRDLAFQKYTEEEDHSVINRYTVGGPIHSATMSGRPVALNPSTYLEPYGTCKAVFLVHPEPTVLQHLGKPSCPVWQHIRKGGLNAGLVLRLDGISELHALHPTKLELQPVQGIKHSDFDGKAKLPPKFKLGSMLPLESLLQAQVNPASPFSEAHVAFTLSVLASGWNALLFCGMELMDDPSGSGQLQVLVDKARHMSRLARLGIVTPGLAEYQRLYELVGQFRQFTCFNRMEA